MIKLQTMALVFHILAAGVYAQEWAVKMTFTGTNVATTINLVPDTVTDEQHSAGNGTFGTFTFRELHADKANQPPSGCSGPGWAVVGGAGVFRFQDASMLVVTIKDGSGCVDLTAGTAVITVNYEITGGAGRFEGASGTLAYKATLRAILRNAANAPALLTLAGEIEGTVSRRP